jgi:cation:H+ antiporter
MAPDTVAQWLVIFLVSAGIVVAAGTVLAHAGDEIATRTGLGGLLVGMLLMAGATSLPEITTNVSAALAGSPDLAVGNVFGSSMTNMATLAIIDLAHRGRVWPGVAIGVARLAAIAIALTSVAVLAVLVPPGIVIGWVGIETALILAAYVATVAWLSRSRRERRRAAHPTGEIIVPTGWATAQEARHSLRYEVARFAIAAAVILLAGPVLALSADGIAVTTGIGHTFVGALLLGIATALPELVASLAATRIGAYDLAVGNLFGSVAFNMTVLFAADVAYLPGPVLAAVAPAQVVAGLGAILLMAIALAAVVHGERTHASRLEPDAVVVLVTYVLLFGAVWVAAS